MTAKEYLLQYRRALERIRQIEDQINRLYAEAEVQAKAPKPDIVRGSGRKQDRTGDIAVRIADRNRKLSEMRITAVSVLSEVATVIDAVPDPTLSRLLYDRYIGNMDWYEVARDIDKEVTYTRGRLHGKAIQAIRDILQHNATNEYDNV